MPHLRTFAILESGISSDTVRDILPLDSSFTEPLFADMAQSAAIVESPADLLFIACTSYSEQLKDLVERAAGFDSLRPVVILCWGDLREYLGTLFSAGASDIISLPEEESQLRSVLEKTIARRGSASAAPLAAFIGAKGGTGKTVCSCNLAAALAQAGKRVAIVDADLQFGDVGVVLGLQPTQTIADLYRAGGTLDREKLESYMVKHPLGLDVLLAPLRPEEADWLSEEFLYRVFTLLRQTHDYVIVDTCPGFPSEVIMTIDASTRLYVIGALDVASLKDSRIGLDTLDSMGYDRDNVCMVLNKADQSLGVTLNEAATVLGQRPDVTIPYDRAVARSYNLGEPIILQRKNSDIVKAFRQLVVWLDNKKGAPAAPAKAGGLRDRFTSTRLAEASK